MKNVIIFLVSISTLTMFYSCRKKGCNDVEAQNYDADAERDDGSCQYLYGGKDYGRIFIYSDSLMPQNPTADDYYHVCVSGEYLGTITSNGDGNCYEGVHIDVLLSRLYRTNPRTVIVFRADGMECRRGSVKPQVQRCMTIRIDEMVVDTCHQTYSNCKP